VIGQSGTGEGRGQSGTGEVRDQSGTSGSSSTLAT
jgi:hypothetical protein